MMNTQFHITSTTGWYAEIYDVGHVTFGREGLPIGWSIGAIHNPLIVDTDYALEMWRVSNSGDRGYIISYAEIQQVQQEINDWNSKH